MSLTELIIPSIIINSFIILISSKIMDEKINFKSPKIILSILFLIIMLPIATHTFKSFFRVILNFFSLLVTNNFIFNKDINKTISVTFLTTLLLFIFEIVASIFLTIIASLFSVSINIQENIILFCITNFFVGIASYSICYISFVKRMISKFIKNYGNFKCSSIIIIILLAICVLSNRNFILFDQNIQYLLNVFVVIIFGITIYLLLRERSANMILSTRYDQLFNYLENYEKELSEKSMIIHEFKNQLIAIKGFNDNKNQELEKYLKVLINEKDGVQSKLLKGMENVPKGGLKGLIYYKFDNLADEGLIVSTQISSSVKKNLLSKISPNMYKDIIKITGILIDNAIESAHESKEKQICLEMYYEKKKFCLILSNTYKGNIDINKLDSVGFTTKGKGRGYGLSLVRRIINDNSELQLDKQIVKNYYISTLTVNLKNISIKK